MSESTTTDPMVAALLRERDSYQRQNLPDRVAQVEEQLRLRGWTDPDAGGDEPDKQTTEQGSPKGRRGAPRRTA